MTNELITNKPSTVTIAEKVRDSRESTRLDKLNDDQLQVFTFNLIKKAKNQLGLNSDPNKLDVYAQLGEDLIKDFRGKFKFWSTFEVELAIEKGIKSGDEFSLSTRTVFKWLLNFDNHDRLKINESILKLKVKPKQKEKKEMSKEGKIKMINDCYKRWCLGKEMMMVPTYEIAKELGLINITDEEKWEIVEESASRMIEKYKNDIRDGKVVTVAHSRLHDLKMVEIGKKSTIPAYLVADAQRVTIIRWFKENHKKTGDQKDIV